MARNNKSLYEVLGVPRNAKTADIDRAYSRIRAAMPKDDDALDPRHAALAKFAYETLSDPERRAEYDESLGSGRRGDRAGRKSRSTPAAVLLLAVLAAAGAGYWYFVARPADRTAEKTLAPQELLEGASSHIGRLQSALMSGEVRELGTAVDIGENEMVTTCRGLTAGAQLSVKVGESTSRAELARANEELDICTLGVKGVSAGVEMRKGPPARGEKIQAIVLNPTGPAQVRQGSVARLIDDAKGSAFELKMAAPLPNGTPVFDAQARLVGIVTTTHSFGEGLVVALGTGRIVQARGPAAATTASAPSTPTLPAPTAASPSSTAGSPSQTATAPSTPSPSPESAVPSPAPTARRGSRGTMEEEGFASLWKEDSEGRMIEVLDHPETGLVGNPLAYWTRWTGRDDNRPQVVQCVVTFGAEESVVMNYPQEAVVHPSDGYWYCAIVGDDLKDLKEGSYHFMIFVDGRKVAENSIRIEKRFFTRGTIAVIVIVVGLGLLGFLRRNKVVSYSG